MCLFGKKKKSTFSWNLTGTQDTAFEGENIDHTDKTELWLSKSKSDPVIRKTSVSSVLICAALSNRVKWNAVKRRLLFRTNGRKEEGVGPFFPRLNCAFAAWLKKQRVVFHCIIKCICDTIIIIVRILCSLGFGEHRNEQASQHKTEKPH